MTALKKDSGQSIQVTMLTDKMIAVSLSKLIALLPSDRSMPETEEPLPLDNPLTISTFGTAALKVGKQSKPLKEREIFTLVTSIGKEPFSAEIPAVTCK